MKKVMVLRILVVAIFMTILAPAAIYAQTGTIGGCIYTGANDGSGPVLSPNPMSPNPLTPPITDASVMVQNQHAGGAFITYGVMGPSGSAPYSHCWTATVPVDGDYVIMFSAPGHDLTSREVTVDAAGTVTHPKLMPDGTIISSTAPLAIDAYLPPLYTNPDGTPSPDELPPAALLVYAFYDNYVNGEPDDYPEDIHLNGVKFTVRDEEGNFLAEGWTGSQSTITTADGTVIANTDGLYYFTDLPPGEVIVTSDASDVWMYPQLPEVASMGFDATTEFYLNYTEEGGAAWDPKLYPGDPGTEGGMFLIWHGYVAKLGQFGDATNPNPYNPAIAGSIYGMLLDADGNDPAEPFPTPGPPGVSPNTIVADGLLILFTSDELIPTHPVATTEADPETGAYSFVNVPPGSYKIMAFDVPLDYVWSQSQVTVFPNMATPLSPWAPRFFARGQGCVIDAATGLPMEGTAVHLRYKSGSIKQTLITGIGGPTAPVNLGDSLSSYPACANGWYNFDDMPEIEVMGYVDVELPPDYRGAMRTDTFNYNVDPLLDPTPFTPYTVTHNAMNRYIQWYTANYRADLYLEPIPAGEGDIRGVVWYDHLERGSWVGDGIYDPEEERTMHGVTVELWDITGTTLITTTTSGKFSKSATMLQGWHQPYTMPPDELGGVYVGPMPGFYEFRGLTPGDYTIKVILPDGFSPSPAGSDVAVVTVTSGLGSDHNVGINTLVPLAGEIEGGVFDDLNIDNNPASLLYMEKAGIPGTPIGVYDHLGYNLGVGYMGNPLCYFGAPAGQCPAGEDPVQKPEMERRFAPDVHIYYGNDPAFPGYNPNYLPLVLPYTFGQGKYKFEADWSLVPVAAFPPLGGALPGNAQILPDNAPVIDAAAVGGSYVITGSDFGAEQDYSTVSLGGQELQVISWSDTEIHAEEAPDPVSDIVLVTTTAGPSNAMPVAGIAYTPGPNTVFVDASNPGPGDGSQTNPYTTITEALNNLPAATPRIVRVAAGDYNERIQITESDIYLIGDGPLETILDGLSPLSVTEQGFNNGGGPVIFIGAGGETGSVENIMISGFTITGGTVNNDDIGAGIFGDYGNRNIDINNNMIIRNGGYYGGGIWLHLSNHDVKVWSNTIAENGNFGGYGGGISVNDEPEYGEEHSEPEHVQDDHCPPTCVPTGEYLIYNNHIFHNWSPDYGGGISLYEIKDHLNIYGNVIEENKSEDHGGGVFFEDTGPIDIHHNEFLRNLCYDDGGAISFEDVGDDIALIDIYNNLFAENIADDRGENHARGGALAFDDTFYVTIRNNTIVGNIVAGSYNPAGGGIDSERHGHEYNGSDPDGRYVAPGFSDPKIYNNIIWNNWRLNYEQPGGEEEDLDYTWGLNYVWIPDNLHVDNPDMQPSWESYENSESLTYVQYNDISNGDYSDRMGNISVGPLFVAPGNSQSWIPGSDWHLSAGSPAIDQAPVDDAPRDDLDRHSRSPRHALVDMGAYEFQRPHPGAITIVKDAIPNDSADFSFTGDLGSFSLDDAVPDDNDDIINTIAYTGLVSDTYVITETIPAGWLPFSAECVFMVNNGGSFDLITDTDGSYMGVAVTLEDDEDVTCTFTNVHRSPWISSNSRGEAGGVVYDDEDIMAYDVPTGIWSKQFDGSDVGLKRTDVDAIHFLDDGSILMSFNRRIRIPGFGKVDDSDIVRFIPTSLGEETAGSFEMFFDASDVGLRKAGEDVDAIGFTPDGRLVVSTNASFKVPALGGGQLRGTDDDLIVFTGTVGPATAGKWEMYFDGSDVWQYTEDVWGTWLDSATGDIYFSLRNAFTVGVVSGNERDIFVCHPILLGEDTSCTFGPGLYFDGSQEGFSGNRIDGFTYGN